MDKELIKDYLNFIDNIKTTKCLPEKYPEDFLYGHYKVIDYYKKNICYSLLTRQFIDALYDLLNDSKNVIELYAGKGMISYQLRQKGLEIKAYDNMTWFGNDDIYTEIIDSDAVDAIKNYKEPIDYCISSWCPYNDPIISKVADALKENNPNTIIIWIGEDYGGCCGSDEFFEKCYAVQDEDFYNKIYETNAFPSFLGYHDFVYLYKVI